MKKHLMLMLALAALLASCEGWQGSKTDLGFLGTPVYTTNPVEYINIQPDINGFRGAPFQNLKDIKAGFDQLIYVLDSFNVSRDAAGAKCAIYSYDQGGQPVASFIPGDSVYFTHIAQTRTLDLLATGKVRRRITIGSGPEQTLWFPAIFRIDMRAPGETGTLLSLNNARYSNIMVYPYFIREEQNRINTSSPAFFTGVNLRAIGILNDDRYYVVCESPFETPPAIRSNFPNNSILLSQVKDGLWNSITVACAGENSRTYFERPVSIATLVNPPQTFNLTSPPEDFFFASISANNVIKVQYIEQIASGDGPPSYCIRVFPSADTSQGDGFLYEPDRFKAPRQVAYTGDGSNSLFVIDGDSLYQFTSNGIEGTTPPPGSGANKPIIVSFGGTGNGPLQLRNPTAVTYLQRIVYVADAGNQRITRYRLSTNFE